MTTEQRDEIEKILRTHPLDQDLSLGELRAMFAASFETRSLPPGVSGRQTALGGRSAVAIDGAADNGVLLYLHGGGYIAGSAVTGQFLAASLAQRAGTAALVPDYRVAPEHPFPAAVDDALAGYRELLGSGVAPERIVVAGDSAGGGLALALVVAARDQGLPQPCAVVTFSPLVDLALTSPSVTTRLDSDATLTPALLRLFADAYLGGADHVTPLASPLYADLTGLPPLLVQVGTHELLLDDATRLAQCAAQADVQVTLEVSPGLPHVFQSYQGELDEADEALDRAADFVTALMRRARLEARP